MQIYVYSQAVILFKYRKNNNIKIFRKTPYMISLTLGRTQLCGSRATHPKAINIATPELGQETNEIASFLNIFLS